MHMLQQARIRFVHPHAARRALLATALGVVTAATVGTPAGAYEGTRWCNRGSADKCWVGDGQLPLWHVGSDVTNWYFISPSRQICAKAETAAFNIRTGSGCITNGGGWDTRLTYNYPLSGGYGYWAGPPITGAGAYNTSVMHVDVVQCDTKYPPYNTCVYWPTSAGSTCACSLGRRVPNALTPGLSAFSGLPGQPVSRTKKSSRHNGRRTPRKPRGHHARQAGSDDIATADTPSEEIVLRGLPDGDVQLLDFALPDISSAAAPSVDVALGGGNGVLCLAVGGASEPAGGGCSYGSIATDPATPMLLVEYLGSDVTFAEDVYRVSGLVADGATDFTIALVDGTSVPVDVSGNAFSEVVHAPPLDATWLVGDDQESAILGTPGLA